MSIVSEYIKDLTNALESIDSIKLNRIIDIVEKAIISGNNIFLCGNGGSAANPSHTAGDWSKEIGARTRCLTDNIASITAWANDSDYSKIFSSQLETFYVDGDILLAFSGSGNSSNVINAVEYVNDSQGTTIGFTGNYRDKGGGNLSRKAKLSLVFETKSMEIIEDLELIICHIIKNTLKEKFSRN